MIKLNIPLCQPGCLFEGANIEKFEIICFCKKYTNIEEESMTDGFQEGFINFGKSKNIFVFRCIKSVFNFESQKYNYISEIIILLFIIEIICGFNCERIINEYIKNLVNFSLDNPDENNNDSTILVNCNDNYSLFQLIISFLIKILNYFHQNLKKIMKLQIYLFLKIMMSILFFLILCIEKIKY